MKIRNRLFVFGFAAVCFVSLGFFAIVPLVHAGGGSINLIETESATYNNGCTSTACTITFSTSTTAGELIILTYQTGVSGADGSTITDNKGDTYAEAYDEVNVPNFSYATYYLANAPAGVNTITLTYGAGNSEIYTNLIAGHYTGIATSNPLDVTTSTHGYASNAWASGDITTSQSTELLAGQIFTYSCQGTSTFTPATGWTLRSSVADDNGDCFTYGDQIVSTTGTYQFSGTSTAPSDDWSGIVAFEAGSAPASGPRRVIIGHGVTR